jgi:hypothetical protein
MYRIHLSQYKNNWRAFVNTVLKFLVPRNARNMLSSWATISLTSTLPMELVKVGSCAHGNEHSVSTEGREYLD